MEFRLLGNLEVVDRRRARRRRWHAAAHGAGHAARGRRAGRPGRVDHRRAVGRRPARLGGRHAPELHLPAAAGPRARRGAGRGRQGAGLGPARLQARRRGRRALDPRRFEAPGRRRARALLLAGDPSRGPRAARRGPGPVAGAGAAGVRRTSTSPGGSPPGSRSAGSPPPRTASTPTSASAATPRWSASWASWWPPTRCASSSATTWRSPCTGRAARPRRCGSSTTPAARCATSSASTPAARSSSSRRPSSATTRRSPRSAPPPPARTPRRRTGAGAVATAAGRGAGDDSRRRPTAAEDAPAGRRARRAGRRAGARPSPRSTRPGRTARCRAGRGRARHRQDPAGRGAGRRGRRRGGDRPVGPRLRGRRRARRSGRGCPPLRALVAAAAGRRPPSRPSWRRWSSARTTTPTTGTRRPHPVPAVRRRHRAAGRGRGRRAAARPRARRPPVGRRGLARAAHASSPASWSTRRCCWPCTVRELEVGRNDAVVEALAALSRAPATRRLAAPGPARTAPTAELVPGRRRPRPSSRRSPAAIQHRAEGNPFFATELARLSWPSAAPTEALVAVSAGGDVPSGVRDVVRRRIALLPEPTVGCCRWPR